VGPTGATGSQGPPGSANISGTTNRIIKFTGPTTGGNSLLFDNGTNVGLGTTTPGFPFHAISGAVNTIRGENNAATGYGVVGINTTAAGTGTGIGVLGITGQSNTGAVWGQHNNASGTGVIGVGNNQASGYFLVAGSGGAFTGFSTGIYGKTITAGTSEAIYTDNFGSIVRVNYYNGTTYKINGAGVVSTLALDPTDPEGKRRVTLHAPETPEVLFEDYGQARLENGFAHVAIDPIFAANVIIDERHPLRVFIQLEEDEDSPGVVVKNKTALGFDVVERNGGKSNTPFQWHIVCNRADEILPGGRVSRYADLRFEVMEDIHESATSTPRADAEILTHSPTQPLSAPGSAGALVPTSNGDASFAWLPMFFRPKR
jgi:hypothetical protein